ncbi:MAG: MarR family transcriptional regulator [Rhodanobacter sp.]|jgi:MarR family transcriptional repressor of emrRAB|nr:MarR family transcriptional regulator [Rhodanobacter sp.]
MAKTLPLTPRISRLDRLLKGHPPELANAVAASRFAFRLAHVLEASIDRALAPLDIGMREYLALVLIADHAIEPLRPSDLSSTLDATRTQITRLLDALEQKKLVQRIPGRTDRRSLSVSLTPAAKTLLRRAMPKVYAVYATAWNPVGAVGTRETLARLQAAHAALHDASAP